AWKNITGEPKPCEPGSGSPRICVTSTHMRANHNPNLPCHPSCPIHFLQTRLTPTHMRNVLRICVAPTRCPFPQSISCLPTTHMRTFLRICMGHPHTTLHLILPTQSIHTLHPFHLVRHAYASHSTYMRSQLPPYTRSISLSPNTHAYAYNPTHMRGTLPTKSHTTKPTQVTFLAPPLTHMRTPLRIYVAITFHIYPSRSTFNHTHSQPKHSPIFHAYMSNATHMHGNPYPAPRPAAQIGHVLA
ncbi:hypothetical protein PIB30_094485, partial [Stylosanthes scabra]|nr:hypothetical protein [Stylosanthes scabra]